MVNAEHFRTVQEEIIRLNGEIERRDIVLEEYSKALFMLVAEVGNLPENGYGVIQGHDLNRAYSEAHDLLTRCGVMPSEQEVWCCEDGKRLSMRVCPRCDETSRAYSAAMVADTSVPNAS